MGSQLRDALLDAVDARDEVVTRTADLGGAFLRRAVAGVVVAAAAAGSTEAHIAAQARGPEAQLSVKKALLLAAASAEEHVSEHAPRILGAGKGPDEGPIRRAHVEARRMARVPRG